MDSLEELSMSQHLSLMTSGAKHLFFASVELQINQQILESLGQEYQELSQRWREIVKFKYEELTLEAQKLQSELQLCKTQLELSFTKVIELDLAYEQAYSNSLVKVNSFIDEF